MSNLPTDQTLYNSIKARVKREIPKHSAYRSGIMVKKYKKAFAKKYGSKKSPYKGKKSSKRGLKRWFLEDWRNQDGKVGYHSKSDIYRPMRRITKGTPVTHGELTKKERRRARRTKRNKGYVYRFRSSSKKSLLKKKRTKSLFKKKRTKSLFKKKRTKRRKKRGYGGGSPKRGYGGGSPKRGYGGKSSTKKVERILEIKKGSGKKKYTVVVRHNKTGKKRTLHFGHKDYQQFKDSTSLGYYSYKNHGTKKRKDAYFSRHSGTKKKGDAIRKEFNKSRGKYTPKILSHIYLW